MIADSTAGRILVVDDNATNVLLLTQTLKKSGYEVVVARDGAAALEAARREQPDLILLDIMMPAVDGFEVCRQLKAGRNTAGIPVIFVTACVRSEDVVRALGLGASDYVTKPFVMAEVVARISVQLRLRRAERELIAKNEELARLAQDLTSRNAELAILSRTDPLTGLLNRRAWYEAAETESARAARYGGPFGVAMIDVDHFKRLNDTLGHRAGDECLREIARAIEATCRATDVAGRYGGEEFVILMPETDAAGASAAGERVRAAVSALGIAAPAGGVYRLGNAPAAASPVGGSTPTFGVHRPKDAPAAAPPVGGPSAECALALFEDARSAELSTAGSSCDDVHQQGTHHAAPAAPESSNAHGPRLTRLSVSVGVAVDQGQLRPLDEMIRAADAALYVAKREGRNCVRLADVEHAIASDSLPLAGLSRSL